MPKRLPKLFFVSYHRIGFMEVLKLLCKWKLL